MIFQILEIKNMASDAKENPGKFAGGQVGSIFLDMLITPALVALLSLVGFFILGYTSWLGGPYGFFQFLFVISIMALVCLFYFLRKIYLLIKSVTKIVVESTIKVESTIIE